MWKEERELELISFFNQYHPAKASMSSVKAEMTFGAAYSKLRRFADLCVALHTRYQYTPMPWCEYKMPENWTKILEQYLCEQGKLERDATSRLEARVAELERFYKIWDAPMAPSSCELLSAYPFGCIYQALNYKYGMEPQGWDMLTVVIGDHCMKENAGGKQAAVAHLEICLDITIPRRYKPSMPLFVPWAGKQFKVKISSEVTEGQQIQMILPLSALEPPKGETEYTALLSTMAGLQFGRTREGRIQVASFEDSDNSVISIGDFIIGVNGHKPMTHLGGSLSSAHQRFNALRCTIQQYQAGAADVEITFQRSSLVPPNCEMTNKWGFTETESIKGAVYCVETKDEYYDYG